MIVGDNSELVFASKDTPKTTATVIQWNSDEFDDISIKVSNESEKITSVVIDLVDWYKLVEAVNAKLKSFT